MSPAPGRVCVCVRGVCASGGCRGSAPLPAPAAPGAPPGLGPVPETRPWETGPLTARLSLKQQEKGRSSLCYTVSYFGGIHPHSH